MKRGPTIVGPLFIIRVLEGFYIASLTSWVSENTEYETVRKVLNTG
jgi:hypothetical protein